MADLDVKRADPLSIWTEPLEAWLLISEISTDRSRRAVLAFGRLSVWMAMQGLGAQDLDEDVIDEYIGVEQQRSRSRLPAAAQYLPLVKRFLTSHGVLVLRGPVSRGREGRPRLEGGPLDCVVLDLVAWLKDQGYAAGTVAPVACTAARLSCWMADRRLAAQDLDQDVLARFVASQGRGPHRHPSSARRMVTVRKFLIATGLLVPAPPPPVAFTPVARVLEEWTGYLRAARGISDGWAGEVRGWAEEFLTEQTVGPDGQLVWAGVDAAAVNRYVTSRGRGYSLSSRRHLVSAMRGLLRWAFLTGRVERSMAAGVLGPPSPSAPGLPRALSAAQVQAITTAADTTTPVGVRDRAVVVLISRLGLRAGEVAGLRLEDLDWHAAQLRVRGKGGRVLVLPIPADVGQVLVDHLRGGRPAGARDRAVFTRLRPPLVALSAKGISGVIARLAARAGLGTVHAHRLRHTAATGVLAAGGSLVEARELLGHARSDTTMVYARTDLVALRELVPAFGKVPGA